MPISKAISFACYHGKNSVNISASFSAERNIPRKCIANRNVSVIYNSVKTIWENEYLQFWGGNFSVDVSISSERLFLKPTSLFDYQVMMTYPARSFPAKTARSLKVSHVNNDNSSLQT